MIVCKARAYPNEHPRPAGDKRCNLFETFVGYDDKKIYYNIGPWSQQQRTAKLQNKNNFKLFILQKQI